jgi:hypothetical protein
MRAVIRSQAAACSFLLLSAILLLGVACTSQAHAGPRFGLEVGVNTSSLLYKSSDQFPFTYWDQGWRTSFTGGATLEISFSERFSLQTGLRYVEQGSAYKFDFDPIFPGLVGEGRVVQQYISVPALMALRPTASRRFFVAVGPELAFLTSARTVIESAILAGGETSSEIAKNMESMNLTLDAAAGYEFPLQQHTGVVSVRYTHGLVGAAKEDDWASDWRTQGIEGLLGMRW